MKENISSNIINNSNNNSQDDSKSSINKLQENLILMGFDIAMINKVIEYFKIKTESEAIDYLIKTEDGMWNHPFIPKIIDEYEINNHSGIMKRPQILMNSVMNKIKSKDKENPNNQISKSVNVLNEKESNDFKEVNDICEICGESIEFHIKKNYSRKNNSEINFDKNNSFNSFGNNSNEKKNILIDDEEDEKDKNFNDNNIDNNIDNNNENNNILNNNLININEEEKEQEINQNECPICMSEFENPLEMENCKHKFCFDCFHSYLVNLININKIDKISCPKKDCPNKELSEDFFHNYLSDEEYFKYRQFKSQNQIARDPKKIFCPQCDSYALIDVNKFEKYDADNPNYSKSNLKCMNGHIFCSCGRPLHENECYKDEKELKEIIKKEKIKRCPKCGFLIKKTKGCNHMICGNPICKYEFCWLCMNEAIIDHYNLGPCSGKQFIDPDSWEYWFSQNCWCLVYLFKFFLIVFIIVGLIIGFIIIPAIGFCIISMQIIYDYSPHLMNRYVKVIEFLICFCLSFPLQSIVYNIFIIVYLMIINIKYILMAFPFIIIFLTIIKYCILPNNYNRINEPIIFNEFDDEIIHPEIELGNRINENN